MGIGSISEGGSEEGAGGPADHLDGFGPRESGEVDQHDDCFDPDRHCDCVDEAPEVVARKLAAHGFEGVFDPAQAESLAETEIAPCGGIGLERESQHRPIRRLGTEQELGGAVDDGVQARLGLEGGVCVEERSHVDFGVRADEQRVLVGEVAVGGRSRDGRGSGGRLDGRCGTSGEQFAGGGDQGLTGALLLILTTTLYI